MDECIDSLAKVTVFSKLGANSEYWKVKIGKKFEIRTHLHLTTAFTVLYVCHINWRTHPERITRQWMLPFKALSENSPQQILMTLSFSQRHPKSTSPMLRMCWYYRKATGRQTSSSDGYKWRKMDDTTTSIIALEGNTSTLVKKDLTWPSINHVQMSTSALI